MTSESRATFLGAKALKIDLTLKTDKLDRLGPLLDEIAEGNPRPRNKPEAPRHRRRLGAIIASVIRADAAGKACHYSRDEKTYRGKSIYKPHWLGSKSLREDIDLLIKADLLLGKTGDQGGPKRRNKKRSTIRMTDRLRKLLTECAITAEDVITDRADYVAIIVKERDGRLHEYEASNPLIQEFATALDKYNAFAARTSISYVGNDGKRKFMPYILLDRTFNSPDLSLGGRFFNGWWETIKKKHRPSIEINGQATVELDFGGMHIRMRYHEAGFDYQADPYDIPELVELAKQQGKPWKKVRKSIKKLTNALLNSLEQFQPWPWNVYPLYEMPYGEATSIILDHHKLIEDDFFKGCGLECMRMESEIIEAVMLRGVEAGVLVLPIHDSVRVAAQHVDVVRTWMIEEYVKRLGYDPVISRSN